MEGKMIDKKTEYCKEEKCVKITEVYEKIISEEGILKRIERIKQEIKNLDFEIDRLQNLKKSMIEEKKSLMDFLIQKEIE